MLYGGIQLYTREQIIEAIVNCLNEQEQQIINTRFGVYDGATVPLDKIESMYGVTREEVRRIEKRVLDYIKCHNR